MTSQKIQLIASLIQAAASVVFMFTVGYNAWRSYRITGQARRDDIIRRLRTEFTAASGGHPTEVAGWDTPRLIEFFNKRLKELGEPWTYPFPRLRWW